MCIFYRCLRGGRGIKYLYRFPEDLEIIILSASKFYGNLFTIAVIDDFYINVY